MSPQHRATLSTELSLLGLLRLRPMHGYEIHSCLADPSGLNGLWQVKLGRLYALLGRLELQGYVTAEIEPQGDRPPRKVFSLTPLGTAAYLDWVEAPVMQPRDLRLGFMLKLYFARLESVEIVTRLVSAQQNQCAGWLSGPLVATNVGESNGHQLMVQRYRRGQIEAADAWLEWLLTTIEEDIR